MTHGRRWMHWVGLLLCVPAIACAQGAPTAMPAAGAPAAAAPPATPAGPDFSAIQEKVTDLGQGLYWIEGAGGNTTVAVGRDGVIVVDSQFAPMYPRLKSAIAALSPRPVKYVINTHYHGDHTAGNASFARDGATVVAQENVRMRLAAAAKSAPPGAQAAAEAGVPTKTYGDRLALSVGRQDAELIHPAGAHTDGDTLVRFRRANVLATGDIFGSASYPNIDVDAGGGIDGMIAAVDRMLSLVDERTRIVPGHGPVTNRAGLVEYRAMLATARERIATAIAAGRSEDEVFAARPLADLDQRWFAAGNRFAEMFPRLVYRSLKKQG